jgi:hypothetical protein
MSPDAMLSMKSLAALNGVTSASRYRLRALGQRLEFLSQTVRDVQIVAAVNLRIMLRRGGVHD